MDAVRKKKRSGIESDDGKHASGIRKALSDEIPSDQTLEGTSHAKYTGEDDAVPREQQEEVFVAFEEQHRGPCRCSGGRQEESGRK